MKPYSVTSVTKHLKPTQHKQYKDDISNFETRKCDLSCVSV